MGDGTLHLALALDGAGYHPAAWRDPAARPIELFDARYWVDLVPTAERGLFDLVTLEDTFGCSRARGRRSTAGPTQVRGRADDWLVEPRRRAERALTAVVAQCYVEGVSTRRVDDVVKAMGALLGRSLRHIVRSPDTIRPRTATGASSLGT